MKRNALHPAASEPDLREIAAHLAAMGDPMVVRQWLGELFTPRELCDLALRWRLMRQLVEGKTQRSIAADLRISLCRITRGSRELKKPDSVSRRLLTEKRARPRPPSRNASRTSSH
jgi:TrpR family trp operon transcriptional repressor